MRLFFSLTLPPAVCSTIASWQRLWAKTVGNVKWVREENLHLTLKFLGEVAPERLGQIISTVHPVLTEQSAFLLTLNGVGAFPHFDRARVLWLGLKEGAEQVASLHHQLDHELVSLGFPAKSKTFRPHLTLGRFRVPTKLTAPALPKEELKVQIDRVVLYQSSLKARGPVYRPMATFKLK